MADKIKDNVSSQKQKTLQPTVVLSGEDKVFLAAVRSDDTKFAYVLALVCERLPNSNMFSMNPVQMVYAFKDRDSADVFHGAVQQMSKMQQSGNFRRLFDCFNNDIKAFNEKVR